MGGNKVSESILVVKTELLNGYIKGKNGLIRGCDKEILAFVDSEHEVRPRPEMEEDPSYRQIIPYVVLTRGDEVLVLRRLKKGGEKRLHGLLSIGVGGHINPVDEAGRGAGRPAGAQADSPAPPGFQGVGGALQRAPLHHIQIRRIPQWQRKLPR